MNTPTRILLVIFITWLLVAQIYWLALPLSLFYIIKNKGYDLVFVAILVDGYYQAFHSLPILSIGYLISTLLISFIKPKLLMYTEANETFS
jgi:hypothetical protein